MTPNKILKCGIPEGIYKEEMLDMRGKIKCYKEVKEEGRNIFESHYNSLCAAFTALYELAKMKTKSEKVKIALKVAAGEMKEVYDVGYSTAIQDVLKEVDEVDREGDYERDLVISDIKQRIQKLGESNGK